MVVISALQKDKNRALERLSRKEEEIATIVSNFKAKQKRKIIVRR